MSLRLTRIGGIRTATKIVASYQATAAEKAGADAVCSGSGDNVQIQAAYDALAQYQSLCLTPGRYNLLNALRFDTDDTEVFSSGRAWLNFYGDTNGIELATNHVVSRNLLVRARHAAPTKAGFYFDDGAHMCVVISPDIRSFKYGFEFESDTTGGIAYNEIFNCYLGSIITAGCYMHVTGDGWVNENTFWGGRLRVLAGGNTVLIGLDSGNNNKFIGVCLENGGAANFCIVDGGKNLYLGCRMEFAGMGALINNSSDNNRNIARFIGNHHWPTRRPLIAVNGGRVYVDQLDGYSGLIIASDRVSTTVDDDSAAAQKVLNVTATTGFYVKDSVLIDEGSAGGGEEWGEVASIQAGVSITMVDNLRYAHTAVQGDAVIAKGRKNGIDRAYDSNTSDIMVNGIKVLQLNDDGSGTMLGVLTQSTTPTP